MKKIHLIVILLLITTVSKSQSQVELNDKWCDKYNEVDKELNLIYQNVIKIYSNDTLLIKNLIKTQNNWIKLRNSDIELYMPKNEHWGSASSMCRCQFLAELTQKRIEFLKMWEIGHEEGWMCGGTMRIKN